MKGCLAAGDGDSGRRREANDDWQRDEVDQEAKLEKTRDEDDDAGEKSEQDSIFRTIVRDLLCHQSHDSCRANVDVLLAEVKG